MRLLLITNDYPPRAGGIQRYLDSFISMYPSEVRVLAPADLAADDEPEHVIRGPHRFMWPTPRVVSWVRAETAAFAPDAVLFGAPLPLSYMIKTLRRSIDVPIGVLCHGAEVTIPAAFPVVRGVMVRSLRRADVLFAVSQFTAEKVAALTRRPVVYVGGAVDAAAFDPTRRSKKVRPVVGCVSRFVPRKRQGMLIDAVASMRSQGRDVDLLLVGQGRLEQRLRVKARRKNLPVRFEVEVPWDKLPDLYAEMDVFCMPCRSRWAGLEAEGLGLVFLEAAAAGLPVLAGRSGGAPETVVPGRTGYVVHDIDSVIEGVERVLDDPELAKSMGEAGRARIEQEFSWGRVVERFLAGFRESPSWQH